MKLSPYQNYKNTELAWLNSYPETWNIKRGKNLLKAIDIRSESGGEELLTVSSKFGVIPRKNASVTMFKADSYIGYKLCWKNDLVINSLWAWAGGLGISKEHGIISSAYGVYRIKDSNQLIPEYLNALVRSTPYQWELQVRSKGIWTSRLQLTDESFLEAPILIPSIKEQKLIARYLTHINNKIQKYISAKRNLIKLLEEQKQAIIHQAVTGVIDVKTGKPYSEYKHIYDEWLNSAPTNWSVNKIKYISKVNPSISTDQIPKDVQVSFVPMENVNDKLGIISNYNSRKYSEVSKGYTSFNSGDIIFAKITPCMENGNCAVVGEVPYKIAFGSTEFIVIRPKSKIINTEFLHLVLRDKYFRIVCETNMKGSAGQKRISSDFIGSYLIALPTFNEQSLIVEHINKYNYKLDISIKKANEEIALLTEYRTKIIADVVTGKVDVRKVAGTLPDESEIAKELENSEEENIEDNTEVDENELN